MKELSMKNVEIPPSQKSADNQNQLLQRLSPTWVQQQKAPAAMSSTSLTRRLLAAVYMRYATDKQDPYSFTRQLDKAKAYAETIGADIIKVYADPGLSGAYTANRPAFNEMMEDAKNRVFNVLIIEEGDRLARKLHITTAVFSTLSEHGVELHSSKFGRWSLMHAAFAGLMSDEQRTRIYELMRSGIVKILKRGLWPGRTPYGYRRVPGQPGDLQLDEETAANVGRIFAMRLSGMNNYQICIVLNTEKVRPPGKHWAAWTVRRILHNPIYVGLVLYFRTEQKAVQINETTIVHPRKVRPMNEWQCAERPDWAIVSLADWQKVQELEAPKAAHGPQPKFLLSRLVHCGKCGRRMRVEGRHNDRCRMKCSTKWRRTELCEDIPACEQSGVLLDSLEDNVIRFVCEKLDTPDALAEMQAAYDKKINENAELMNRERVRLENERRAIHQRLDATHDAAMVAGLTTEVIRTQRENYCARIDEINNRIAEIPRVNVTTKAFMEAPLDTASFLSELTPMRDYNGCSESLARLMAAFRTLVEKVVVVRDKGSKTTSVTVHGPISNITGENSFTFEHETRAARHIELANKVDREGVLRLTNEDWSKVALHVPVDSIWIEEFDEPIDLRSVLDAIIFAKRTKVGIGNSADRFGPKRQVWAAARMLNYSGALDVIEDVMKKEGIGLVEGISLSLEAARTKRSDPWKRVIDWNERRRMRVLARFAKQSQAEDRPAA
jgi:site-specific DNA recombinase